MGSLRLIAALGLSLLALQIASAQEVRASTAVDVALLCCDDETIEEAAMPLENTHWKLTELSNAEIEVTAGPRQPHMTLNSAEHNVGGNGGCNGFGGSYRLEGEKLSFSQVFSTMMYCEGLMETEQAFLKALEQCAGFAIEGSSLALIDADGAVLALFEAGVPMGTT